MDFLFLIAQLLGLTLTLESHPTGWPRFQEDDRRSKALNRYVVLLQGLFQTVSDRQALADNLVRLLEGHPLQVGDESAKFSIPPIALRRAILEVFMAQAQEDMSFQVFAARAYEAVFAAAWAEMLSVTGVEVSRGCMAALRTIDRRNALCAINDLLRMFPGVAGVDEGLLRGRLVSLAAEGRITLVEELVRAFGWSGLLGAALVTDRIVVHRGIGGDGLVVRHAVHYIMRAALEREGVDPGIRAALLSTLLLRGGDEYDLSGRLPDVLAAAQAAGGVVVLDLAPGLEVAEGERSFAMHLCYQGDTDYDPDTDNGVYYHPPRREERPRYRMACDVWKGWFGTEPPASFNKFHPTKDSVPGGIFHGIPSPVLEFEGGHDLDPVDFVVVAAPSQMGLIKLLCCGRWADARLLVEWFGWSGAFGSSFENYGRYGHREGWLAPLTVVEAHRSLLGFVPFAFVLAYQESECSQADWGVTAALGAVLLADPTTGRLEDLVKARYAPRQKELDREIEEATCAPLPSVGGFEEYESPPPAPPCPQYLIERGAQYKNEQTAWVARLRQAFRAMYDRALDEARQHRQPVALDIFE